MSDAWKRSGQVKAALGKSKEAMTCIRNAISLDSPKPDPDSFNQIGNLLYGSKKYGEAVKDGFERWVGAKAASVASCLVMFYTIS